ncbi:MAG TPA: cell division protein ZapA [Candidatus Ratteibacteria bacterium]|jgi:cell division protein ZapA (FtsZ GTPase activity inhibitor)|uniref:Cell division protein ZapA n=1 Tax=candidate division TA06 bacterium ADurb.Bin131 TaxID=1852827 RepID=A0A1V6C5R0_UNCT6|nr:MAG: Cell division protein ZapA [candidate division TA06 bacterium ADurb.Bin131]HON05169.1 cell division protein ZapA [bacterium]HRS06962.1 cell division protein ZapA [Candidatus Ratteibacteria bacterium]HPC30123.1 cell division protein ZapA [bacterium]HQL64494.1 cell division protein ZapA [bacterium]
MKKYQINILGRNCTIATDKDELSMRRIEKEINEQLALLKTSMPHADNLDLCIVCLFLLSERIDVLQKSIEKMKESSLKAKVILASLRKEVEREIKGLNV